MTGVGAPTLNEFSFGSFDLRRDRRPQLKAQEPVGTFGHAVRFGDLRPIADPSRVKSLVPAALGVAIQAENAIQGQISLLWDGHILLALDHQDLIARVTHVGGVAIERARRDEALKRREAFLAEVERLSSTGSFSWRTATDELVCSHQLHRIFGFDKRIRVTLDLLGSRLHPEDRASLRETIERARQGGEEISHEHRLLMPANSVKYVRMVAHAARAQDGSLEYIGAVQDMTQQYLSEVALNQARSELTHTARVLSLGALAPSLAHEVKQPLTGIITNASACVRMLSADLPDVQGAEEAARRTLRDGQRAAQVIDRLRSLFAKRTTRTESVDLNDAAREVVALTLSELQRNRIAVRMELAHDLPSVEGDRVQLQQVILNLLLNACEAMAAVEPSSKRVGGQKRL